VGGTNPSLLEALAAGNCVVVLDVPYNIEVIEDAGLTFAKEEGSLANTLKNLCENPLLMADLRKKAKARILEAYTWQKIVDEYEQLFLEMLN
jgi:rhamnosyltransferase